MNRMSTLLVAALFTTAAVAAGCSSDDDSGGGNTGGVTGTGGKGGSGGSNAGGAGGKAGSGGGSGGVGAGGGGGSTTDANNDTSETGDDAATDANSDAPSGGDASGDGPAATMSFFVTSDTSDTGKLGGLAGADKRCNDLAVAAGVTGKTWAAYLSAETAGPGGTAINAKDRIGTGPWFNSKGVMVAANLTDLHARKGDYKVFLDEKGNAINGQWIGSPKPNEHDILTGSKADGTVFPGQTCTDWTSDADGLKSRVGHADGLGPGQATTGTFTSWNSSHDGACNDTAPGGGKGRIYCFAK
jgi:hypothetical protein